MDEPLTIDEQLDEIIAGIAASETEITDWINQIRTAADLVEKILGLSRNLAEDAANG